MNITPSDRAVLRELAKRVAETAALPVMEERRRLWRSHHRLARPRALMLIFPENAWSELLPPSVFRCEGGEARWMEWCMRTALYAQEHFDSDNVVEGEWLVPKVVRNSGWGLQAEHVASQTAGGAWAFKPVIESRADLARLKFPEISHDEAATREKLATVQEAIGDILPVRLVGIQHISFHLMQLWTGWRGLEQTLMDMIEEPEFVHEAMAFLEEGHRRMVRQYEEQNLLSLNNDNTYFSTGGNGHIDQKDIVAPGFDPEHVRACDMWGSAESQELTVVRPKMHEEFAMQYEARLMEMFALTGYGCCDDFNRKLDLVLKLPRLRSVSVSPFTDIALAAEKIGTRAVVSWKPQPSHLVGDFNEEVVRSELRRGLEATRGCAVEVILKDTNTCENRPELFDRWSRICREEIEAIQ